MAIQNSPLLVQLYAIVDRLKEKYGCEFVTQAHMLMAFLKVYTDPDNALNTDPEMRQIAQTLSIPVGERNRTLTRAYDWLAFKSNIDAYEALWMLATYQKAQCVAQASGVEVLTAKVLFDAIVAVPSPLTEHLFSICLQPKDSKYLIAEDELWDEDFEEESLDDGTSKINAYLQIILDKAKSFAQQYSMGMVSQTHFLIALFSLYCSTPEYQESAEFTNALSDVWASEDQFRQVVRAATDWICKHKITEAEADAFSLCYETALSKANENHFREISIEFFLSNLLENPTRQTVELFGDIFQLKKFSDTRETQTEVSLDRISDLLYPIKQFQTRLREKIYGQDEAINALVSGCFNLLVNEGTQKKSNKPKAVFLFAGAPGVGKTYLAQVAAKALHLPFRRFDMSSFSDKESPLEFSGSDKVFRASHEGLVTGFVQKHPKCVLLFDEIEKAHMNVIHLFLQILDAGHLKDSHTGRNVFFTETIIIMTTNVGKSLYENLESGAPMPSRKTVINALSSEINPLTGENYFPPAICSRFASGNIVLFNPLDVQSLLKIGHAALQEQIQRTGHRFSLKITADQNLCAALLFAEGNRADARSISGRAANFIAEEVYNWLKFAYEKNGDDLDRTEKIRIRIPTRGDTKKLFDTQGVQYVLLYSENKGAFKNFVSGDNICILQAQTPEEAMGMVREYNIAFAVSDIFGDEKTTLNIEDTTSEGRQLMEQLIQANVPTYVYRSDKRKINVEEAHALLQNGALGFVEQGTKNTILRTLKNLCKQVHVAKTLRELGRSKKVLSFDCVYNWDKDRKTGTIDLVNLRVIPAIDAQDTEDVAGLCLADTTFEDVVGAQDAKDELMSFTDYLQNPKMYSKNNIPAPKGVLLYGPPGTGKTMLAKAFAHESGAAFIAATGNQFLSGRKGEGAKEVRRLFALARKYAPAVLFIDEIDIIAKDRLRAYSDADEVVNALLNEMDGFSTNTSRPVFVLGATNFDAGVGKNGILDAALLRRFDRRIFVDLPNAEERTCFLQKRLRESKQMLAEEVIHNIVARSVGMSLAELESVVDFALRRMVQNGYTNLSETIFNDVFETFVWGQVKEQNEEQLKRVAIHEAGHAIAGYLCGSKPCYITIAGRGSYGGYVQTEEPEQDIFTKQQLLDKIQIALSGRAAEMIVYGGEGGISTGAAGDLRYATEIARQMITVFGMIEEGGLMSHKEAQDSQETTCLCNQILHESMELAVRCLQVHRDLLLSLSCKLLEKNHLMGHELEAFLKDIEVRK